MIPDTLRDRVHEHMTKARLTGMARYDVLSKLVALLEEDLSDLEDRDHCDVWSEAHNAFGVSKEVHAAEWLTAQCEGLHEITDHPYTKEERRWGVTRDGDGLVLFTRKHGLPYLCVDPQRLWMPLAHEWGMDYDAIQDLIIEQFGERMGWTELHPHP